MYMSSHCKITKLNLFQIDIKLKSTLFTNDLVPEEVTKQINGDY